MQIAEASQLSGVQAAQRQAASRQAALAAAQGGGVGAAGSPYAFNPFGAWVPPYGGFPAGGFGGGGYGGAAFPGGGKGNFGGKGKGDHHYFKGGKGFKGKGGGKGKDGKGKYGFKGEGKGDGEGDAAAAFDADPRRQIEMAQRRAKQRDRCAISQAQRTAQQRFEKDLLDRVQGYWIDESDPSTSYVVEGSICAVSGGENTRTFRNRISVYGGELCWDAKRFWHYLDMKALPPLGEEVEKVFWKLGEGSPPTQPITWLRGSPPEPAAGAEVGGGASEANDGKEGPEPAAGTEVGGGASEANDGKEGGAVDAAVA